MADFVPEGATSPFLQGFQNFGASNQMAQQNALQTRLKELQAEQQSMALQEAQANLPVQAQERELKLGTGRAALERLPFESSRALSQAQAGANPARLEAENQGALLEAQSKVRRQQMSKMVDEMELFTRAFGPMLEAHAKGDFEAANRAWDDGFDMLEKGGMQGVPQMRVEDRAKLLPGIKQNYLRAINDLPTIRKRIETEDAQAHAIELERERAKGRVAAANARIKAAERSEKTREALFTSVMKKLNENKPITAEEVDFAKDYLEGNLSKTDEAALDSMATDKARMEYLRNRAAGFRRKYPKLYGAPQPAPQGEDLYKKFGLTPPK